MTRVSAVAFFFLSALFLPWFAAVFFGVLLIAWWQEYGLVILGGVLMDILFGASIVSLGGISFLYTALFALLSLIAALLRRSMLE